MSFKTKLEKIVQRIWWDGAHQQSQNAQGTENDVSEITKLFLEMVGEYEQAMGVFGDDDYLMTFGANRLRSELRNKIQQE